MVSSHDDAATVSVATQNQGTIVFDISLTGYQDDVLKRRVRSSESVAAAVFTDHLAASCVRQLSERTYNAEQEADANALAELRLEWSDGERSEFAKAFLEYNSFLLCRTEWSPSEKSGDGSGEEVRILRHVPRTDIEWKKDDVERLHQAFVLRESEDREAVRSFLPPMFETIAAQLNQVTAGTSLAGAFLYASRQARVIDRFKPLEAALLQSREQFVQYSELMKSVPRAADQLRLAPALQAITHSSAYRTQFQWLDRDLAIWSRHAGNESLQKAAAFHNYESGVAKLVRSFASKGGLKNLERFSAPAHAFTTFVSDTERLSAAAAPYLRIAYDASLKFSGAQFDESSDLAARFAILSEDSDITALDVELDSDRTLNLFSEQRDEIVSKVETERRGDVKELLDSSRSAQLGALVLEVLQLVVDCNHAARIRLQKEIFKQTTRTLQAAINLPLMLPTDIRTFGDVIDDLYLVLYEGAGDDSLRFLEKHGGVFKIEEASSIMDLKFLRTKWLRHDADHGDERKIQKTWTQLGDTFKHLGLTSIPVVPDHFYTAYRRLLEGLRDFLKEMRHRLRR